MEQWDAYDKNFNKIKNRILIRGEQIPKGFFHLYVEYLCETDCSKNSVTLQSGETVDYQWVTGEELNNMGEKLLTTRMWKFIKI